jgi:hypothetical protein
VFRRIGVFVVVLSVASAVAAQTPQPFPRPNTPQQKPTQPPPAAPAPPPTTSAPQAPASKPPAPQAPASQAPKAPEVPKGSQAPSEAELGAPVYPGAVYLSSYDAGRGQRFYLFGVTVPYTELVGYYRTVLKQKGDELFEAPPTHQFETGRFRDDAMAFAPSVTIKDYTYGGSAGYPNPKPGVQPARFPTVIQIVPAPK